jgi:type IV secretory pathway VirB9-like protein
MQRVLVGVALLPWLLIGCTATSPAVPSIPMPADIGWSAPVVQPLPEPEPEPVKPPERPATPFEKVYAFEPGQEYKVDVAVGFPMDVMLEPGELINHQTHGDRAPLPPGDEQPPWDIRQGASGMPESPHLFITVTKPGLLTGLTVTTNRRVYLIHLRSVAKSRVRLVRWTYADTPVMQAQPKPPRLLPDATRPQSYHVGYTLEASEPQPTWLPRQVIDDGRKTYILFPVNLSVMSAPMIRLVSTTGYELVNPRMVGSVMVLDHMFNVAELRLGSGEQAEVVRVVRQQPVAIACPGDERCPRWPVTLAQRSRYTLPPGGRR